MATTPRRKTPAKKAAKKAPSKHVKTDIAVYEFLVPIRVRARIIDGKLLPPHAVLVELQSVNHDSFVQSWKESPDDSLALPLPVELQNPDSILYGEGNTPSLYWVGYPTNPQFDQS